MTKLIQCMAPSGQKYQREVIVGQFIEGRTSKRQRESPNRMAEV